MSCSRPNFSRAFGGLRAAIEVHTETVKVKSEACGDSRLMDLPHFILENIYSLLEISDRVRLNLALPITSRVTTDTKKDKVLVLIHRIFQKITLRGCLSQQTINDLGSSVTTFLIDNSCDPTVTRLLSEMPLVAAVVKLRSTMCPLACLIMSQPVGQKPIVWDESKAYYNLREIMDTMWRHGTPAIFDALMASKNPFSEAIKKDSMSCVLSIVDYQNTGKLLAHYISLATYRGSPFTCPVKADKILHYFKDSDRLIIMRWNSPQQLRMLVEEVGVSQTVLNNLVEHYANYLETEAVSYLESVGAQF